MNKKYLCLGLTLIILLAPTTALATTKKALATNESSYEWGYKYGFGNYRCFLKGDCEQPVVYALDQSGVDYLCGSLPALINASGYASVPITNLTACQDGYHNGWKDWCKTDQINCTLLITLGVYPQTTYTSISQELNWKVTVPIIAPDPTASKAWNQGFSDGYLRDLGLPVKITNMHTREYWYGYTNGTRSFQYNKGFAEGSSNKTEDFSHGGWSGSYLEGYNDSKRSASPKCTDVCVLAVLPNQTKDHYMQWYIGYHNGAEAADFHDSHSTAKLYPDSSSYTDPSGGWCGGYHNKEYCAGYENGYDNELHTLHP